MYGTAHTLQKTLLLKYKTCFTGEITLHVTQNSCTTMYPRNMVCFRYMTVNTPHKGGNKDDNSNNNNNTDLLT